MFMGIAGAFMLSGLAHAFHAEMHLSEELPLTDWGQQLRGSYWIPAFAGMTG